MTFSGFMPVGSVCYIDNGRIGDFDATGKGKPLTDVWGWAISNGNNGTRNRLNKFLRTIATNTDAGKSGGSNEVALTSANIPSFDIPVDGSIGSALGTEQFEIKLEANKISDGSGGDVYLLRVGTGQSGVNSIKTIGKNLAHTHTFDLKGAFSNPVVSKISLIPEYLFEIPIQRINV
jgi:hypothetical protein